MSRKDDARLEDHEKRRRRLWALTLADVLLCSLTEGLCILLFRRWDSFASGLLALSVSFLFPFWGVARGILAFRLTGKLLSPALRFGGGFCILTALFGLIQCTVSRTTALFPLLLLFDALFAAGYAGLSLLAGWAARALARRKTPVPE